MILLRTVAARGKGRSGAFFLGTLAGSGFALLESRISAKSENVLRGLERLSASESTACKLSGLLCFTESLRPDSWPTIASNSRVSNTRLIWISS